jgi:hypothetical protein
MAAISTAADTFSIGFIFSLRWSLHGRRTTPAATGLDRAGAGISPPPDGTISLGTGNVFDMIAPPLRHFERLQK